ncbi:MAG: DUF4105 domain-containing protein [Steroidobacteraceae bacterium]
MTAGAGGLPPITAPLLATLLVAFAATWGAVALWYQAPGGRASKTVSAALWTGLNLAVVIALWQGRFALGLSGFALAFGGLIAWWLRLAPSNDRLWADDVAQMTSGTVEGNRVTLHNVRNFAWRTETDRTQRWETRCYDLEHLNSVDMIMSYWSRRSIAHMLISFGFDDSDHVAFSVEVRRERHKGYSEIGGFFKEFELSVIAADERDVVYVRTNVRGEDAYLYRVRLPPPAMRSLFLAYINEANRLVQAPRFYHTVTGNCTTLVYHMMKRIIGHLPFDYRVLLSGYMPEYVYRVGGLDRRYPLEELRALGYISERAKQADRSNTFSADIRRGVPNLPDVSEDPESAPAPHR